MPISSAAPRSQYSQCVNRQWVRLLDTLQMNVRYERCLGAVLTTADGRQVLDFLSGYCVHNTGHNHPHIVAALQNELHRQGPAMLQSHVPESAGELAERLLSLAGGRLSRAFFCSSGSEGVEAAIKFSRAATGRAALLYAEHGFHGLTCGALSLMSDRFWKEGFGPLLPGAEAVPFGDLDSLAARLATRNFAAFIAEPLQSEAGIRLPDAGYWSEVERLCRRYGTLLALDEVQTGLYRTGTFLAAHRYGVEPDIVVLAKALSGGLVPVGAVLTTEAVSEAVYSSIGRALVHTSTFSENSLAMRAGLATLDVLEDERLGENAERMGAILRNRLRDALAPFEIVKEVRGEGLLCGIEFTAPRQLRLRAAFEAFRRIHPAMFGQVLVMRLFRDHGILTQICGNHFMILKAAPPLGIEEPQVDAFVRAVAAVVAEACGSLHYWTEALGMATRLLDS
jgi:ornithine--oxo-acid transaminase